MANAKATRMTALPGATLTMKESHLMVGGNPNLDIHLNCPTYLIEHPKGLVLFDTGCNPEVAVNPHAYWGKLADYFNVSYTPDLVVDAQIKALGYKIADVKYVVVSHLHLDHAGGLALFPDAEFFIMRGEIPYAYWPDRQSRGGFILGDIMPTRRFKWRELAGDTDILGDGSLMMLKTAGHTPGECSLMVNLPHRKVVLTGDTVHIRHQLVTLAPMDVDWDKVAASDSIRRLKNMQESGDVRLIISHDPEDWAEFPHAPVAIE